MTSPERTFARSVVKVAGAAGLALIIATAGPSNPAVARSVAQASGGNFASDRLSVEVIGAGPDVIFLPGLGSSREVWRAEAERLSGRYRVHLVQLAGFAGLPSAEGESAVIEPVVGELTRYIRANGLVRPTVVGHSLGGLIALLLAQRHPALVSRVMTVDSLPFYSVIFGASASAETARPFADQAAAAILAASDGQFRTSQEQLAAALSREPEARRAILDWSVASDRRALATAMRELMTTDARAGLKSMTVPVWAVYATDATGGMTPSQTDALWSREYGPLPGVRLVRINDSRHFIMADQPERLSEIIREFLGP